MALNSIGSIAIHILNNFNNVPSGVSGNMVEIVDMARQHVANYAGTDIGSNNISAEFHPAIVDFAKADTIDAINAQSGGEEVSLEGLSVKETGEEISAQQYRQMGESKLSTIGRKVRFAKSLS